MRGRCLYRGAPLQRRLFFWFGASILVTGLVVSTVMHLVGRISAPPWRREMESIATFVADRFAHVWNDPAERNELANAIARDLHVEVELLDRTGNPIFGTGCARPILAAPIERQGVSMGQVRICTKTMHAPLWRFFLPAVLVCAMLWAASRQIARRLARPLAELSRVAGELGAGHLSTRMTVRRHDPMEARVVGEAINDMAARIEKQLRDQRELLAAVSHELRTPLARIRLLGELARGNRADPKLLDELDREVVEIDQLVADLLASSRLDFSALILSRLDAADLAERALERAGVDRSKLMVEASVTRFEGDATLMARALGNLIENAKRHGGGLAVLRIGSRPLHISFEVEDGGPGFAPGDEGQLFQPFFRGSKASEGAGTLGLGLALVERIAQAHGGTAYASNLPGGGARVGIELPTGPRAI